MEISFSDGSVKKISSDGSEDIRFPDGTRVAVASNGDRTLVLANGQKEFHTAEYKVRSTRNYHTYCDDYRVQTNRLLN